MQYSMTKPFIRYYQKPITLHSGRVSHWLIDADQIFQDASLRTSVLDCWEGAVKTRHPNAKRFAFYGIPTGGELWAQAIAARTGGYVLKEPMQSPENIGRETIPILVDDVTTTGKSFEALGKSCMFWPRLVVARRGDVFVTAAWMSIDLR